MNVQNNNPTQQTNPVNPLDQTQTQSQPVEEQTNQITAPPAFQSAEPVSPVSPVTPTTPATANVNDSYVDSYTPPVDGMSEDTATATKPEATEEFTDAATNNNFASVQAEVEDPKKLDEDLDKEIARLEQMVKDLENNNSSPAEPANESVGDEVPEVQQEAVADEPKLEIEKPETTDEKIAPPQLATATAIDSNQPDINSEKIEDQNIFTLLGIENSSEEEKDKFLDELQQVVWEDFLETDLEQLVTAEEKVKVDQILQNTSLSEVDKQEQALVLLEGIIPNLQEIMVEKALELKKELVKDRIAGMKENLAGDADKLQQVQTAETQIAQGQWRTGTAMLNRLIQGA